MDKTISPAQTGHPPSRFWRAVVHSPTVQSVFVWTMQRLFRLRVQNLEYGPPPGPYILASNHASHYDLFLALAAFCGVTRGYGTMARLPVPVIWDGIFKIPIIGSLMKAIPCVGVDHHGGKEADRVTALREMIGHLRAGRCLVMACEGERLDALGQFERGAAFVSLNTGVPIIPVSLRGAQPLYRSLWRPSRFWGNVEIILHPPLDPAEFEAAGGTRAEIVERLTQAIRDRVASKVDYPIQPLNGHGP